MVLPAQSLFLPDQFVTLHGALGDHPEIAGRTGGDGVTGKQEVAPVELDLLPGFLLLYSYQLLTARTIDFFAAQFNQMLFPSYLYYCV